MVFDKNEGSKPPKLVMCNYKMTAIPRTPAPIMAEPAKRRVSAAPVALAIEADADEALEEAECTTEEAEAATELISLVTLASAELRPVVSDMAEL